MYISNLKGTKFESLIHKASKVVGRTLAKKSGHKTTDLAYTYTAFINEYCSLFGHKWDITTSDNPFAKLSAVLMFKQDDYEIFEALNNFFYDIVFDIAKELKKTIKYHAIFADEEYSLYGINTREVLPKKEYLEKLSKLFSQDDLDTYKVIVNPADYNPPY